ncbi:hypothetical protein H5410_023598 [Solanum commersonii]|uniref:Uncharacterized protein n=1 Tax=Solanum commersonii TaxID=4109 RepID=A0A9J5ZIJ2_SOLCO|nr:hypothetical protein H5410_023598 [Solanum commersonii]
MDNVGVLNALRFSLANMLRAEHVSKNGTAQPQKVSKSNAIQKSPEHKILKSFKFSTTNPEAVINTTRQIQRKIQKRRGNNGEGERGPKNREEQQITIGNSSTGGEIWNVEFKNSEGKTRGKGVHSLIHEAKPDVMEY